MKLQLTDKEKDAEFLFAVYASSRQAELELWGWPEAQRWPFLRMQYEAQQRAYEQRYSDFQYRLIVSGGQKAGRVATVQTDTAIILADIILLPEFQNRGLGSKFLQELQAEAGRKQLPVSLTVLQGNRARRLYERFGFQVVGGADTPHVLMQWLPVPGP